MKERGYYQVWAERERERVTDSRSGLLDSLLTSFSCGAEIPLLAPGGCCWVSVAGINNTFHHFLACHDVCLVLLRPLCFRLTLQLLILFTEV